MIFTGLLVRFARKRAQDLRWRAFLTRVFARVDYPDQRVLGALREELLARLLDLRARNLDALAAVLGGQ